MAHGFVHPLEVLGEVEVPGGLRLRAMELQDPLPPPSADAAAIIQADPATVLTVRSRQAGDFVRFGGRAISLKRFLLEKRVPADLRDALPLVANGAEVLWVPGWPVDPPEAGRFVRVELVRVT
jgi:tRNA(Ile)-lysidine synthetase-like protein